MSKQTRVSTSASVLALLIVAAGIPASASGFQLREQGASNQGLSYAGVSAGGSDISSMFFNPASLTRFDGTQLNLGFTNILPSTKFSDGAASRSMIPAASPLSAISGPASTGNDALSAVTPTVYAMWSLSKDLKVGFSVNVPYGLTTQYDANWIGRYHDLRSHLETLDLSPTVAYRFSDQWSGGVSFVARQAKAELSQAVDFGYEAYGLVGKIQALDKTFSNTNPLTKAPIVLPGLADGSVFVKGDSWAYGFKAGVLYEPTKDLRVGLGYQSAMKENIKGTATFTIPSTATAGLQGLATVNAGHTASLGLMNTVFTAATANGPVSAELNLPSCISLGLAYELSPTFTLSAEVQRTQWSTFEELRLKFTNNHLLPTPDGTTYSQPDQPTTEKWTDSTFVSVGAACHPGNGWTYRLGLAMDKAPVDTATRTPRIPDADRTWISAGTSYQFSKTFGLDFGYTHIIAKDSTVNLSGGTDTASADFFKGNLSGTYKNAIDIWALQARWSF
jgi:long-chain fatty acid transport protein